MRRGPLGKTRRCARAGLTRRQPSPFAGSEPGGGHARVHPGQPDTRLQRVTLVLCPSVSLQPACKSWAGMRPWGEGWGGHATGHPGRSSPLSSSPRLLRGGDRRPQGPGQEGGRALKVKQSVRCVIISHWFAIFLRVLKTHCLPVQPPPTNPDENSCARSSAPLR